MLIFLFSFITLCGAACVSFPGADLSGNDLATVTQSSVSSCCSGCQTYPGCVGWAYKPNNVCSYKGAQYPLVMTSNSVNYVTGPNYPGTQCFQYPDWDFPGGDFGTPTIQSSSDSCCLACRITAGCVAWTYVVGNGTCMLKNVRKAITAVPAGTRISGFVKTGCDYSSFTTSKSGMQCLGLVQNPATTIDSCMQACCSDTTCQVWQWCAPGASNSCPANTCWIGRPSTCKPATLFIGQANSVCTIIPEDSTITISTLPGFLLSSVLFASYGTPSGTCGNYQTGSCATDTTAYVNSICQGRTSCDLQASNSLFGDPCYNVVKRMFIEIALDDINECQTFNAGCFTSVNVTQQTCFNTQGSFYCRCPTGYDGDGMVCNDINECSFPSLCAPQADCLNTPGSFVCGNCSKGYYGNGSIACYDVNECASNNGGCSTFPMVSCTNTVGSFQCGSCPSGWTGNGSVCTDVNECATNNGGCDSSTVPPVTCNNGPGNFSCGPCPSGYTGNGTTCTDINECNTSNGNCSFICLNLVPGFACFPSIIPLSLRLSSGSGTQSINSTKVRISLSSSAFLSFQVRSETFSLSQLQLNTTLLHGPSVYQSLRCLSISWSLIQSKIYNVTCQVPLSVGLGYSFALVSCVGQNCQTSSVISDSFDFPFPTIQDGTLATPTTYPQLNGNISKILASNSLGERIVFNGTNFVNNSQLMAISFGLPNGSIWFSCTMATALTTSKFLVCDTSSGGSGQALVFRVCVPGGCVLGNDEYSYKAVPTLSSVSGCQDVFPATENCPTNGGTLIMIEGTSFLEPLGVFVEGVSCIVQQPHDLTTVTCALPPGTGVNQTLVVSSADQFSQAWKLISYAAPEITEIVGTNCTSNTMTDINECPRQGGTNLTVKGSNLGLSGGTLLVGVSQCLNLIHSPSTPHSLLTCILPQGNTLDTPVIFLQNGQLSNTSLTISYTQCLPGTYQEKLECTPCIPGYYSKSNGTLDCLVCEVGTYSDRNGTVNCPLCPKGKFGNATGLTVCYDCGAGLFTDTEGALVCSDCPKGTSGNSTGSSNCTECDAGFYQPLTGQSACLPCQAGYSGNSAGQSVCVQCSKGRFSNSTKSLDCQDCNLGEFQLYSGQTFCDNCSPGFSNPAPGQVVCLACTKGWFSNISGLTTCFQCDAGSYNGQTSQSACSSCGVGYYSDALGSTSCNICPPGSFAVSIGAKQCALCNSGYYQDGYGQSSCKPCSPGSSASDMGSKSCSPCSSSEISGAAAAACLPCLDGAVANADRTTCLCPLGTFGVYNTTNTNTTTSSIPRCQPCPTGAVCNRVGLVFNELESAPGYWRKDNNSLVFYQCFQTQQCLGGLNSTCGGHHTGPICAVCESGYGSSSFGSSCEACPSRGISIFITFLVIFAILLGLAIMFYIVLRPNTTSETQGFHKRTSIGSVGSADEALNTSQSGTRTSPAPYDTSATGNEDEPNRKPWYESPEYKMEEGEIEKDNSRLLTAETRETKSPMFVMKIAVGFLQITSNLSFISTIPWPSTYRSFMNAVSLINVNFVPWQSVGCLANISYYDRLLVVAITPPVLMALAIFGFLLPLYILDKKDFHDNDRARQLRDKKRQQFFTLVLFTLFLTYPSISSSVLGYWVCRQVDGVSYLVTDFTLQCYDSTWYRYLPLAIIMLLVYPLGVPLFFGILLYKHKNVLHYKSTKRRLGFLYQAYHHHVWYFELVDMIHKLFLSAILKFFPTGIQIPAGLVAVILYLMIILLREPYIRKFNDIFHMLTQVALFIILLSCNVLYQTFTKMDSRLDLILSIFLISLVILLILFSILEITKVFRSLVREYSRIRLNELAKREEVELESPDGSKTSQTEQGEGTTQQTQFSTSELVKEENNASSPKETNG